MGHGPIQFPNLSSAVYFPGQSPGVLQPCGELYH